MHNAVTHVSVVMAGVNKPAVLLVIQKYSAYSYVQYILLGNYDPF